MNNKHIDWCGVKTAYVTGRKSYAELALEMNISHGAIALRARREKWGEARKAFRNKVIDKVVNERADSEAQGLVKLLNAAEHMAGALSEVLQDEKGFLRRIAPENTDSAETEKLDTRAIRDLTVSLKNMAQLLRNLYRLPTQGEEAQQKLAREKFEYEKLKAAEQADHTVTVSMDDDAEAFAR